MYSASRLTLDILHHLQIITYSSGVENTANMDNPPGYMANRMTIQCDRQGRVNLPIRSRGPGSYIIAVDRPVAQPVLRSFGPNGQPMGQHNFNISGR